MKKTINLEPCHLVARQTEPVEPKFDYYTLERLYRPDTVLEAKKTTMESVLSLLGLDSPQ